MLPPRSGPRGRPARTLQRAQGRGVTLGGCHPSVPTGRALHAATPGRWRRGRLRRATSAVEDAVLLLLELEVVQHAGGLQLTELLELRQLVVHAGRRGRGGRRGGVLLLGRRGGVLLLLLGGPPAGLPA